MTDGSIVGFVTHPVSSEHEMPAGHPETSQRMAAITQGLGRAGLLVDLDHHAPERAARSTVELAHEGRYVDLLIELDRDGGGRIDADTAMGPHSLEAALRGTQGAVDAASKVLSGEWVGALMCMRPPGHHATSDRGMGFCLTNHIAVAARWAITAGGIERVVILDWDAHHGNGTQDIFWSDPDVLYISVHQYPWYPGTGDVTERGAGNGYAATVNVPLPAGAGEDAYDRAFDLIEPVVASFDPQLVLVSAGYDAHHRDPLCMMRLTAGSFFRMTRRVAGWGRGPVCVLEGGYDLDALGWSVSATAAALLGREEPLVPAPEMDPLEGHPDAMRWVERAAAILA